MKMWRMKKGIVAVLLIALMVLGGVVSASNRAVAPGESNTVGTGPVGGSSFGPAPSASGATTGAITAPTAAMTFSRTVLVETFTAVWCIHCPAETGAMWNIEHSTNRSFIDIAELHVCAFAAGQGPCLENYVPPDGTSNARAAFYNVCGFPDVFFDGNTSACGASNSIPQMQSEYDQYITNASEFPGTVGISQTASVDSTNVTEHATILSGLTGSYNVVTYLVEYLGLQNVSNGYGPHDLGYVVRATLVNHPENLVAGSTTSLNATGTVNPAWNPRNLSVVTFVQQNSTKIVENANLAPVTTLTETLSARPASLVSGTNSTITVQVANSSTGAVLTGATVNLTSGSGGSFLPASGVTNGNGTFTAIYTAPTATSTVTDLITAQVSHPGYTGGSVTTDVLVTARVAPDVPRALSVTPAAQRISLNWTPPLTGAGGLTYHVFRSISPSGPYSMAGSTGSTEFTDSAVQSGRTYWYTVDANNSEAFSTNSTAVSASSVVAMPQGLPGADGWWLDIAPWNFTSADASPLQLYLPNGNYSYQFGAGTYAYDAPQSLGSFPVAAAALSFNVSFLPRYATIVGTVSPLSANVSLNGTPLTVTDGTFLEPFVAGVYPLTVSAAGYITNTTVVTLTAGNTTPPIHVVLRPMAQVPPNEPASGGLTSGQTMAILVVAAIAAVAVLGAILVLARRRKRNLP